MPENPTFLFVAAYGSEQDARADYETLKDLHAAGLVGTYDAAVVTKSGGKVHVHKHEKPTQHGAWTGLGVGALLGILFPPSVLASGIVGATAGGLIGHFWRGMSRSDVRELGTLLDDGEAALVVIGTSEIEAQVAKALSRAQQRITKELDAEASELDEQLTAAAKT
jgi:uncharacterized membrane protein